MTASSLYQHIAKNPSRTDPASVNRPYADTLVDVAGGAFGGAARWRAELDGYLSNHTTGVRVIGRDRRLSATWLLKRERLAAGAAVAFATNNVSFALAGRQRRVLVHNALHFLHPHETHLLDRMPVGWRAQIPVVRHSLSRADEVVVPCSAMAERVQYHVPSLRDRLIVRMHPITAVGPRETCLETFILVPVVPGPYKNLFPQLRMLLTALRQLRHPAHVRVTADPHDIPADLAADPRLQAIGLMSHASLTRQWRAAHAVFFPSEVEAFGYPLAEARVYGIPVLAPDGRHALELAASALRPYDPTKLETLHEAIDRLAEPVTPDGQSFDPGAYFDFLLCVQRDK